MKHTRQNTIGKEFFWLLCYIFKVPEAQEPNKYLMFIYWLMHPLLYLYHKNSKIYYVPWTNIYTINGIKFSGEFFDVFKNYSSNNSYFKFIKSNDTVRIEHITNIYDNMA